MQICEFKNEKINFRKIKTFFFPEQIKSICSTESDLVALTHNKIHIYNLVTFKYTSKSVPVSNNVFAYKNTFTVSKKGVHFYPNYSMSHHTNFSPQHFLENNLLFFIDEEFVYDFSGDEDRKVPHNIKSGICASVAYPFFGFENGKIYRKTNDKFELFYDFKTTVISLFKMDEALLVGIFDKKIAILKNNGFVFSKIPAEIRKVIFKEVVFVLDVEKRLYLFESNLNFINVFEGVVDIFYNSFLFVAFDNKRIVQILIELNSK